MSKRSKNKFFRRKKVCKRNHACTSIVCDWMTFFPDREMQLQYSGKKDKRFNQKVRCLEML